MNNLNEQEQLFKAVRLNEIEEVRKLIEAGADLNAVCEYKRTALHIASIWGCSEIVKILIEAGVNVNVVDKYGDSALHRASFSC